MPAGEPSLTFVEKMLGKRKKNIHLPNESGKVDPRTKQPSVMESLAEAKKNYESLKKQGLFK